MSLEELSLSTVLSGGTLRLELLVFSLKMRRDALRVSTHSLSSSEVMGRQYALEMYWYMNHSIDSFALALISLHQSRVSHNPGRTSISLLGLIQ